MSKGPDNYCYNCHHPVETTDTYCPNCGQKHHKGHYTFKELISNFFSETFNIDGRLFKTLGGLVRPGFLTQEFFRGRQKSYNSPIRVFLVIAVVVFALLGWNQEDSDGNGLEDNLKARIAHKQLLQAQDSLLQNIKDQNKDPDLEAHLDTLAKKISRNELEIIKREIDPGVIDFDLNGLAFILENDTLSIDTTKIPAQDIINLTPNAVIEKYLPNLPWYKKVFFRQALKTGLNSSALTKYLMSRLPIFLLLITPLYALLFYFLYYRRGFFFIEHFIFILHLNAGNLLIVLSSYLITQFGDVSEKFMISILAVWALYFILALKRFYGQSWLKTIFKFFLVNFFGAFIGIFGFLLILAITFLIF